MADESKTSAAAPAPLIFRQLFDRESCTYTYLLADGATKEGLLIDPVLELADRDVEVATQLGVTLRYGVNTHAHADHITSTGVLKKKVEGFRSVISAASKAKADVKLAHGDVVTFGSHKLKALATPGHTEGCMSFVLDDNEAVFTGDAVMIRGCGRTDFQGGSAETLYESVKAHVFTLPDTCKIYPAHDYKGRTMSTVAEEKAFNPRLTKSKEEFVKIMAELGLPYPKKIDVAVPANLECGVF